MAIVTYVLGDCPGCGRKGSFGNVDVFGGNHVFPGCKGCNYKERIPLPNLKKKIVYLDQFFFSHAFRGQEPRFLDAAARIERVSASNCSSRRTHQSTRTKRISGPGGTNSSALSRPSPADTRSGTPRTCTAFSCSARSRHGVRTSPPLTSWKRTTRSRMMCTGGTDTCGLTSVATWATSNLSARSRTSQPKGSWAVGLFDGWRKKKTTFEENLRAEYEVAAKGYIDFYISTSRA